MDLLVETAAEIEKLLISDIDELFEKRIFLYYGKTTSDGVKLGPSWWSTKLAEQGIVMSPGAIKDRALRWRQKTSSEADPESAPTPSPSNTSDIRGARSAIKKFPNLAKKLIEDPEVRKIVEKELDKQLDNDISERRFKENLTRKPKSGFAHEVDVLTCLRKITLAIKDATNVCLNGPAMNDTDDLVAIVDWQTNALSIIRSSITGKADMDDELARILQGE